MPQVETAFRHLNDDFRKQFFQVFFRFFLLLTGLAAGVWFFYLQREETAAADQMRQKIKMAEMQIFGDFEATAVDLHFLSGFEELKKFSPQALQEMEEELVLFVDLSSKYTGISLVDAQGKGLIQLLKPFNAPFVRKHDPTNLSQSDPELWRRIQTLGPYDQFMTRPKLHQGETRFNLIKSFGDQGIKGYLILEFHLAPMLEKINRAQDDANLFLVTPDKVWLEGFRPFTPTGGIVEPHQTLGWLQDDFQRFDQGAFLTRKLIFSQFLTDRLGKGQFAMESQLELSLFVPQNAIANEQNAFRAFLLGVYLILVFALALAASSLAQSRVKKAQALRVLREQEAQYRDVTESTADGILLLQKGVIRFGNPAAAAFLGCSVQELKGQWLSSFVHPRSHEQIKALSKGEMTPFRQPVASMLKGIQGNEAHVEVVCRELPTPDGPALLLNLRDMGERNKADERMLETMAAIEEANRAKSQFLANMSHEVRTPINVILGMTSLALETTAEEPHRETLKIIQAAAENLMAIMGEILDLAKIDSGTLELQEVTFAPFEQITSFVTPYESAASEKGLKLSLRISEGVPKAMKGDPVRLRQVVMNLVSNAVKFTDKGEVRIKVDLLETDAQLVKLKFEISDTGIGIPLDWQDRIFDFFSLQKEAGSREFGGTGLGLMICKSLVSMMGGEIWVESEPEKGSRFMFTACFLPALEEVPSQGAASVYDSSVTNRDLTGLRILVVEDKQLNQVLTKRMLEAYGATVEIAANGKEGLESLKAHEFDLVLMDVQMPVMDGLQATKEIRETTNGSLNPEIPVIAVTAHAMRDDKELCLRAGMNAYLSKPVYIDQLRKTILKTLRKG